LGHRVAYELVNKSFISRSYLLELVQVVNPWCNCFLKRHNRFKCRFTPKLTLKLRSSAVTSGTKPPLASQLNE
jgi:hypothetical protein